MKLVYRAASLLQVSHARNVLISAGIDCELRNQYLAGALGDLPMLETWPQLWVADGSESAAPCAPWPLPPPRPRVLPGLADTAARSSRRNSRVVGAAVLRSIRHSLYLVGQTLTGNNAISESRISALA